MASTQRSLFDEDDPIIPAVGWAEIVFDRPLDQSYTYAIPPQLAQAIGIGKRVHAPFGRGNKPLIGFCVGLLDNAPEQRVKTLLDVVDDESLVDDQLLRLTRWMADYYMCGWGQVLNAIVPAGVREQAGTRLVARIEAVPEAQVPNPTPALTAKQFQALGVLRAESHALDADELARRSQCGSGPIQALIDKGFARKIQVRVESLAAQPSNANLSPRIDMNPDQLRVWASVEAAIRSGGFQVFLLHGVTGSGKTELYLRAIEEVIAQGREAIVLVPEISLTPQTIDRFRGRCGNVAVLHSHLRPSERGQHWRSVAHGHVQVVVGARSAVFAPTRRLGLIVIDEEHENSFKQESTPRYHARDVAVKRAQIEGIPVLMGSATPSLESWHNAARNHYKLLQLPNRVLDLPLPDVHLIDLRHEPRRRGRFQALSAALERAMRDALRDGGQIILMLNRRGFSTFIHCPACGSTEQCKFCDVSLTFHKERAVLLCHFCGYEQMPPDRCSSCGQSQVRYQGVGTEKLQAEIDEKFHGYVCRRMDSDTTSKQGSHERILAAFREGLVHILMGTQMIAKGLDFPNVTLVGVVNADMALHLPDFRSAERTFQLLAQVAGRTGRGTRGGRVLIQTYNPEQPCVHLATRHDYLAFVKAETALRKAHGYPPYQRMARLILRGREPDATLQAAERLALQFQMTLSQGSDQEVRLLGPAEAPLFRLKGYYRYHFQIQSPSSATLHRFLRSVLPAFRVPPGIEYALDIDPIQML